MSEPSSMNLIMPNDTGAPTPTKQSGVLTLMPGDSQKVHYYEGEFEPGSLQKGSIKEIRNVIMEKKRRTPTDDMFVIIKPSKFSNYRNVVDLLDEMIISDIKRFALVKITEEEESHIK